MSRIDDIRTRWEAGSLNDDAALLELCAELDAVEQAIAPLEQVKQQARTVVSEVVEKQGGNVTVFGFGRLVITSPTAVASYDRDILDALLAQLEREGNPLADKLKAARKMSQRAGHLQITREKG